MLETYIAWIFLHKNHFHLVVHLYTFKTILDSFSTRAQLTFWIRYSLWQRGCPLHLQMFSGISGLYPKQASSKAPAVTIKNGPQTLPNIPWRRGWGQKSHPVENLRLRVWILYSVLTIFQGKFLRGPAFLFGDQTTTKSS